jgi:hypothetical protein
LAGVVYYEDLLARDFSLADVAIDEVAVDEEFS